MVWPGMGLGSILDSLVERRMSGSSSPEPLCLQAL